MFVECHGLENSPEQTSQPLSTLEKVQREITAISPSLLFTIRTPTAMPIRFTDPAFISTEGKMIHLSM